MPEGRQTEFDFSKVKRDEAEKETDYVDVEEDRVVAQVIRYLQLADQICTKQPREIGYIDKAMKTIIIARFIQRETHGFIN